MAELSVIGKSVTRTDAIEKATGRAEFCSDIQIPGMLHMKVLRSPHPHAKILNIDTSEAKRLPGVRCVVTSKDAPQQRWGVGMVNDQTVLAQDVVRFIGEPVAAVAADTIETAEEAVGLIKVEYEELPAVFDLEEAVSTNPPAVVHPGFPEYYKGVFGGRLAPDRPNVLTHMKIRKGDVEKGFKEADLVIEDRFLAPSIQHCTLETHGVVVCPESDGGLTIRTGRQNIWGLRGVIAAVYNIRLPKVRVIQQYLGGAFGGKIKIMETIACLVALKTRQPVKWTFTREEEFIDGGRREAMVFYIKDGVKKDGTLVAREIRAIVNSGAYENVTGVITRNSSFGAVASYRIPNLKWDSYGVYTNEPPVCSFRGFGVTETTWAVESHMDMLAERLGISKVEIRKKNILKEGEPNAMGEITHSIGAEECLEKMSTFIKLDEKSEAEGPWRKGKGIALGNKYSTGLAVCQAKVKVTEDESIIIYHSADELGQGCNTAMAQITAEAFGVSIDDVRVVFSDTMITPFFAEGSTSSRVTFHLGNAILAACKDAKRRIFEIAAVTLEASPDELEAKGKEIYVKSKPEKKMRIGELFASYAHKPPSIYGGVAMGGEIIGTATRIQDSAPEDLETGQIDPALAAQGKTINSFYAHVAKAAEVAVNIETGQVKVLRCGAAADVGKMINPKICEQQAEGGMAMGISDAIYEQMKIEKGAVMNPNFVDYKIPFVTEMPLIENMKSEFVESAPHRDGPFGAKGFTEAVMIGMEPAIGNAVYDAVGVRIKDLPIECERLLKALKENAAQK